jgi:hypothetical protein
MGPHLASPACSLTIGREVLHASFTSLIRRKQPSLSSRRLPPRRRISAPTVGPHWLLRRSAIVSNILPRFQHDSARRDYVRRRNCASRHVGDP